MSAFTTRGVVAWADTDASGHYHYTAAYRWAENTEHALYRSVIPDIDISRFPRRATAATYDKPLAAGDEYTVELDAERVGTTSITYAWRVLGPDGCCVQGSHTVVHLDTAGRPAAIPDALRERLAVTSPQRAQADGRLPSTVTPSTRSVS